MWITFMRALLAATLAVTAPLAAQSAPTAADSTVTIALSAEQMRHYIAVKQALMPFWQAPAHAALLGTARATAHAPVIRAGMQQVSIDVFDYPNLVKQDAALAAIFTTNHFAPSQFEPTQVAAFTALLALVEHEAMGGALPGGATVLGRNVEMVKAHRQELAAVGLTLQVSDGMGNMDGGMDP
jgi:hypothetical protein